MAISAGATRALLVDGTQVWLRPAVDNDETALLRLHHDLSERSMYLRFFTVNRDAGEDFVRHLLHGDSAFGYAIVAELSGGIVGVASYQTLDTPQQGEVALIVADTSQSRGIGTLLLEHLISHARQHGVESFHAEVLAENSHMLRVFADIGLTARTRGTGNSVALDIPLRYDEGYLDAVLERERSADIASLGPVLAPTSVAVVGASDRRGSVGRALLTRLLEAGFQGPVFPVHPRAETISGLRVYKAVSEIPETPELAVIAVPARYVPDVAEQCGQRGVKGLVVISTGVTMAGEDSPGRRLAATVGRYGMRLIGPSGIGIANTDHMVSLDTTFTRRPALPGEVGIVTQSGGIGIAIQESLQQAGIGVSTFVSTGDKFDVSSNDMLLWWGRDGRTRVAVVYVESFGNPRKFARLARQLAHRFPIVAVRSVAPPDAQTPAVTRDALFRQAGVIATDDVRETTEVVALLDSQPLPSGPRLAIVSNAGGGGVLAADACARYGMQLAHISGRDTLAAVLPHPVSLTNPVNTAADVEASVFAKAVDVVAGDPNVDAVLAVVAPTALGDIAGALDRVRNSRVPVVGVVLGQPEAVTVRRPRRIPVYAEPAPAVRALSHAVTYAHWRGEESGRPAAITGIDRSAAGAAVEDYLDRHPTGGWLDWSQVRSIAAAYGIPLATSMAVTDPDAAAKALSEIGAPVAVKAMVPGIVHRTDEHAVMLNIAAERDIRETYQRMSRRYGDRFDGALVQHMAEAGEEFLVAVSQDATFGPLIQVGAGGTRTDLLRDRATRLLPLTDRDVEQMLASLRIGPVLTGYRGAAPLDLAALTDLVHRVARLAQDLPQVAECELNPAILYPTGCLVVDIKVRVEPTRVSDPYLRRLR